MGWGGGFSPEVASTWDGWDAEAPSLQMLSCVPDRDGARMGPARADTLRRGAGDGKGCASILTRHFSSFVSPATASAEDKIPCYQLAELLGVPVTPQHPNQVTRGKTCFPFPFIFLFFVCFYYGTLIEGKSVPRGLAEPKVLLSQAAPDQLSGALKHILSSPAETWWERDPWRCHHCGTIIPS